MADEPEVLTLGALKTFLNGSNLPDDTLIFLMESDIDDPRETNEVPVVKVTAALGIGQRSVVTFHSF